MSHFTAVFDACVLYPAPLRSLLMYLAMTDLFQARWTDVIHEEWMSAVRENYANITKEMTERIRDLMNAHVRDCLVTGYEGLVDSLALPDPDDRHVLAAAIHVQAGVIVTHNLRDFPSDVLGVHGIEAQHPDAFIMRLLELAPDVVCAAVKQQRESLKDPPMTVEEFLAALTRQSLPRTVARLRELAEAL